MLLNFFFKFTKFIKLHVLQMIDTTDIFSTLFVGAFCRFNPLYLLPKDPFGKSTYIVHVNISY